MEELLTQVANIGFPIVVATYMLIRMESKLTDLNESIIHLNVNIV